MIGSLPEGPSVCGRSFMRSAFAGVVLSGLLSGTAYAAPVWLDCRASGDAGNVNFRMVFDPDTSQASTTWAVGGGRPSAGVVGEIGTDNAYAPEVSPARFWSSFVAYDGDTSAYSLAINRADGSLIFSRSNGQSARESHGRCAPSASGGVF